MSTNSRRWYALAVMLAAVFLAAFDFNVVTIAIPSIQRGLGTSFGEIQLIVAAYALSFAVLLITGGRLGDLYGRRRMYVIGMTGFTIASALCGLARSPTALIGSRLLDRKSTRLNSSHLVISYAVFCLKKKKKKYHMPNDKVLFSVTTIWTM